MNTDRLWLLVNELRRGEFIQGRGFLRGPGRHCAVGVACEVYRRHTGEGRWVPGNGAAGFALAGSVAHHDRVQTVVAPREVVRWYLHDFPDSVLQARLDSLFRRVMRENDAGASFEVLARRIEAFIHGDLEEGDIEEPEAAYC